MEKKVITFETEVQASQIKTVLEKNYLTIITEYFELQRGWLYRAYQPFNDIDKYLILISLVNRTFNAYKEYFIKMNYDEFYSQSAYEIKKFNVVDISRQLTISKETARRKILELEKLGVLKKEKKNLFLFQDKLDIQKPNESIMAISRFMSSLSKKLRQSKMINQEIPSKEFEQLIKNNYTVCWNIFLEFQITLLTDAKIKFLGDMESWVVYCQIIYNQNLHLNQKIKGMKNYEEFIANTSTSLTDELTALTGTIGLNAMTISDLTGIPRPTVIRKLNFLQKNQWIQKDKNGRYTMIDSTNTKELNKWRIKNIEKISTMIGRIFNAARLIEIKKDIKKKQ